VTHRSFYIARDIFSELIYHQITDFAKSVRIIGQDINYRKK